MKKTPRRILITTVGLLCFFIVLELSLRGVGLVYSNLSEKDPVNQLQRNGNKLIRVLCIGDSVTFGIGAPRDLSYPAQLQELLNKEADGTTYTVINRGRPGQNSAQLLLRLEGYLKQFQPDIVTILIGAQNQANYFGYREYLKEHEENNTFSLVFLQNWLDKIRVYKFFRLLLTTTGKVKTSEESSLFTAMPSEGLDIIDTPGEYTQELNLYAAPEKMASYTPECAQAMKYKLKGEYQKAADILLPLSESPTAEAECYLIAGSVYREQKKSTQAIEWFKKGIERDPGQFANYEGIGEVYRDQNQLDEALYWYKKGFENAREETLHKLCYVGINVAFEDSGDIAGAIKFFSKETKRELTISPHLHTLAEDYLQMFRNNAIDSEVHKWIKADLLKIISLCQKYQAKTILQNYPNAPMVNYIYRNVAEELKIPLVDNQAAFKNQVQGQTLNSEYFVPDGHPNSRGYQLMARTLLQVLIPINDIE